MKQRFFTKLGLAALMAFGAFTAANAAYPSFAEIATTYKFKGTLTQSSYTQYQTQFDALNSEFEFFISGSTSYEIVTDFVLGSSYARQFDYDEDTGIITFRTYFWGQLPGDVGLVYLSPVSYGEGDTSTTQPYFNWQVNEDGSITIPDFYVKDHNSDNPIATYTDITVTRADADGGDDGDDTPEVPEGPGPAVADLYGTYTFTADAVYESSYSWVEDVLTSTEFTLSAYGSNVSLDNFLKPSTSVTLTYNQEAGSLTFPNVTFLGTQYSSDFAIASINIGSASGSALTTSLAWYADEEGNITIPNFSLIDANSGNALIAKFTNIQVEKKEEVEETYDYPALDDLLNTYSWGGNANVEVESLYTDYIQPNLTAPEFKLTQNEVLENQVIIENFLNSTGQLTGTYDRTEGTITFTAQALTYANTHETWRWEDDITDDNYPKNVSFGITDETDSSYGVSSTWVWTVSEDGDITIPSFKVWNNFPYNGLDKSPIVTFDDVEIGGTITENIPDGVVNPDITNTTSVGTYEWIVTPIEDMYGKESEAPQTITVEVLQSNSVDTQYYIQETGSTSLFNGNIISATDDGLGNLSIIQSYAGRFDGQPVWFSPFQLTTMTEPQASYAIPFDETDGFKFQDGDGFAWFVNEGSGEFNPTGELYSGFLLPGQPEVTISNLNTTVAGYDVTVTMNVEFINVSEEDLSSIEVIFTPTSAGETITTTDIIYADGVLSATISDLAIGTYNYGVSIALYDLEEKQIVISNTDYIFFEVTQAPEITISRPEYTTEAEANGTYTVTLVVDAELTAIDENDFEAEDIIAYLTPAEGNTIYPIVTYSDGQFVMSIANLEEGTYAYTLSIELYLNGQFITSNDLDITILIESTGVNGIGYEEGNVRYFNLNGVEIARPDKGIYIRVEGDKATKVVR